ncbi:MAG: hypothetical protein AAFV88_12460 [Planctomycetota bacterium]
MNSFLYAAASGSEDGSAIGGLIIIGLVIWFLVWICSSKPKGYDFTSRTEGTIRRR